ncbi:transducer protein Htr23 [uncultured Corynebacterium sp.]|uniref:transducer protein Htr23 n=1 Tax=uncultured Corynebacterium sp. TaxID=159447 RepID=UPI0025D5A222|nr:transducer protein Htr23 [uncultured Corynebacterium sp.]
MTTNTTFALDPEHTLSLARDLDAQSAVRAPELTGLPGGVIAEFCQALAAAHATMIRRDRQLRQDLAQLADVAVATTHATLTVDSNSAGAFAALRTGPGDA